MLLPRILASVLAVGASAAANDGPIIDLGSAGTYRGVLQNNGTVEAWRGIPYAKPPLGSLRFMPPVPLESQANGSVVNAINDVPTCVQFSSNRHRPNEEDCLKLLVWKPTGAKKNSSLPVLINIHGGGLQNGGPPDNDLSDWVGRSQDFIAVSIGYRLGLLGFMAHEDLPSANAGLLDQRLAMQWVKQNIRAFGGNPNDVTIMGESGGGLAIVSQLALYDGDAQGLFQKAITRSMQRSPMFKVEDLADRNAVLFNLLNCTEGQSQIRCFQSASPSALVNAYNALSNYKATDGPFKGVAFGVYNAFMPMIDGITLTDTMTHLYKAGKIVDVPVIVGSMNDEGAQFEAHSNTTLSVATNKVWNLTDSQVAEAITYYPVNATFGSASPDNFFLTEFHAYISSLSQFGEQSCAASERMIGRYMSEKFGSDRIWAFRYNAPAVGTDFEGSDYPLAYVAHTAENTYLETPIANMTSFEKAIADEFRAYFGSFIRTGSPNTQKLPAAPEWYSYGALGDYIKAPVRLLPQFGYPWKNSTDNQTGTQVEVVQKAQIIREEWWMSEPLLESLRM